MENETSEFGLDGERESNGNAEVITCDEMVVLVTEWRWAAELGNLVRDMVLGKLVQIMHPACCSLETRRCQKLMLILSRTSRSLDVFVRPYLLMIIITAITCDNGNTIYV